MKKLSNYFGLAPMYKTLDFIYVSSFFGSSPLSSKLVNEYYLWYFVLLLFTVRFELKSFTADKDSEIAKVVSPRQSKISIIKGTCNSWKNSKTLT